MLRSMDCRPKGRTFIHSFIEESSIDSGLIDVKTRYTGNFRIPGTDQVALIHQVIISTPLKVMRI